MATIANALRGRRVVLYSDNTGAEHATDKGSAKAADHNKMVHEVWTLALRSCVVCVLGVWLRCLLSRHNIHLWIERVPSKLNISDLPSRGRWQLMYDIGALWWEPVLPQLRLLQSV